jgi:hypothetical protein
MPDEPTSCNMTPRELPSELLRDFAARRVLLWVTQANDLRNGEEPHAFDTPAEEVRQRYRQDTQGRDAKLGSLFWEAVWFEGADSPVLKVLRESTTRDAQRRPLVVLAGESEANAQVSPEEFLPVCVLPGLLDGTNPENTFGATSRRKRERIAFDLAAQGSCAQ